MAIGDIQPLDRLEGLAESGDLIALVDRPELMADPIRCADVDRGRSLAHRPQPIVDRRGGAVGEEHRPGLGIERADLPHAVLFLRRARQLMATDAAGAVGGDRGRGDQAGLPMPVQAQAIGVVARARVLAQDAFGAQALQILARLGVDGLGIGVGALGQIDLGTGDVQEARRPSLHHPARLGRAHHVVGRGRDLGGLSRARARAGAAGGLCRRPPGGTGPPGMRPTPRKSPECTAPLE